MQLTKFPLVTLFLFFIFIFIKIQLQQSIHNKPSNLYIYINLQMYVAYFLFVF